MTPLDKMLPGQKGKVVEFEDSDSPIIRRLMELGMVPGRYVKYIRKAPLRDPLVVQIEGSYLSLRNAEASLVKVEVEN
ncbi:MAG: FeoA family protein [candidate division Zixibacteria bacterium]|nr:FeoA family protein [candidate division Zixibacteria bacterium]